MADPMIWDDADIGCDHCGREGREWEDGLMGIDREFGVFTCDFVACPTCLPETIGPGGLVMLMREGATFAQIHYYWFSKTGALPWQTS